MTEALDAFQISLSQEQQDRFQATSKGIPAAQDVTDLLSEIDNENSARRSRVWAKRMQDILNSVQQYCSIVDTCIQANPAIAALVWGSVKFVILVNRPSATVRHSLMPLLGSGKFLGFFRNPFPAL